MSLRYLVGDVHERLKEIPDNSIDVLITSPPFLALRSYLPADHPDKHREIGSEPDPATFIDTLLGLTAEWERVLAPHGSICVELGDTYSGSGGAGGDYNALGMRAEQPKFRQSRNGRGEEWPLPKSMCLVPHLYTASLAYGRNLLTGQESPAGRWRVRNVICWARPNPPVGALGDKFRPATSYITVACKSERRWFDLDAVRTEHADPKQLDRFNVYTPANAARAGDDDIQVHKGHPSGAPPLDWVQDLDPEDGDWLWRLSTQPYKGSHYATFPMALPKRLIEATCPRRVCTVCGQPSQRITTEPRYESTSGGRVVNHWSGERRSENTNQWDVQGGNPGHAVKVVDTVGWTDCGCEGVDRWRTGVVLDPFAGSGTTLEAAQAVGRHGIGIDLDEQNAHLARERVGMFLEFD